MKKKLMIGLIAIMLTLGSVQTYATTILDTNLVGLITSGINTIISFFDNTTESETNNLESSFREKIKQYVNQKTDNVYSDIDAHVDSEINRANQEINNYYKDLTSETDAIVDAQLNQAKQSITIEVNKDVEKIKDELEKELEKSIKENLK